MKAVNAIENGLFKQDIIEYDIQETFLDENENKKTRVFFLMKMKDQEKIQQ